MVTEYLMEAATSVRNETYTAPVSLPDIEPADLNAPRMSIVR